MENQDKQLDNFINAANNLTAGMAKKSEIAKAFDVVTDFVVEQQQNTNNAINQVIADTEREVVRLDEKIDAVDGKIGEQGKKTDDKVKNVKEELETKIAEIEVSIPEMPNLNPLRDELKNDIRKVEEKIPEIPKIPEPDTPDEVVKKVNAAKEQIDYSKIKNLPAPQVVYKGFGGGSGIKKVNAGSNITVTDTGNGQVTIASTASGSGAVDSVNGQTGVVVLDADDIDDTSTTNKFVTATDITKLSNLSGTNTGDQTSIVGITGTKAQFDTAVTDGNFLYVGDITQYTDELAQDAVGGMVANSTFVSLAYNDTTPSLTGSLSATGTPSSSTFLRGDNTWATPAGSGDVSKVGTPVDNQVGVWTGDGTIEGTSGLTYSGTVLAVTGDVTVTDEAYGAGWNGSLEVPTKNAVYDKIETLSSGGISEELAIAYSIAL